jgi:hypothetical protein
MDLGEALRPATGRLNLRRDHLARGGDEISPRDFLGVIETIPSGELIERQ